MIRNTDPLIIPLKEHVKKKQSKTTYNKKARERRKGKPVIVSNPVPYKDFTPEQKETAIGHVKKALRKKLKTSPQFKNLKTRLINAHPYANRAMKYCKGCETLRGITAFDLHKAPNKGKKVRRSYCFMCRRRMNKEYYLRKKHEKEQA